MRSRWLHKVPCTSTAKSVKKTRKTNSAVTRKYCGFQIKCCRLSDSRHVLATHSSRAVWSQNFSENLPSSCLPLTSFACPREELVVFSHLFAAAVLSNSALPVTMSYLAAHVRRCRYCYCYRYYHGGDPRHLRRLLTAFAQLETRDGGPSCSSCCRRPEPS